MEKYEIESFAEFRGEYHLHAFYKLLTGLTYEEIAQFVKTGSMTGSKVRKAFNSLGFNTNQKFIAFDPETIYPAMIRCHHIKDKKHWYPFVYYDDKVYAPHHGGRYDSLNQFLKENNEFRITSMLQVWI